jgi:DNA-binding transcriptional MerR regulator
MSPPVGERPFLSIGEVLSLLKDEFPDVTISKIRFLESQGLLDPERTPSGYRKFYDDDVDRLRWILRQQREHFLPLKVIKGRLAAETPAPAPAPAAAAAATHSAVAHEPASAGNGRRQRVATASAPPAAPKTLPSGLGEAAEGPDPLDAGATGVSLTIGELAGAAGLDVAQVQELERFGLLAGRTVAGTVYYDEDALIVANLASGFFRHGVEARHLRMYLNSAQREASFFEQVVMPMMKQRNPQARVQAVDTLGELARLGQGLRAAMLRVALKDYLE